MSNPGQGASAGLRRTGQVVSCHLYASENTKPGGKSHPDQQDLEVVLICDLALFEVEAFRFMALPTFWRGKTPEGKGIVA